MQDTSSQHAYGFLTRPEVQFLDAAVERLIPTDELGPGARDAGVTRIVLATSYRADTFRAFMDDADLGIEVVIAGLLPAHDVAALERAAKERAAG